MGFCFRLIVFTGTALFLHRTLREYYVEEEEYWRARLGAPHRSERL